MLVTVAMVTVCRRLIAAFPWVLVVTVAGLVASRSGLLDVAEVGDHPERHSPT